MPEKTNEPVGDQTLEMFKEKQKTIRKAITYGVVLIVGLFIIFMGGKLKLSKEGIEISKDVLAATDQKKEKSSNGEFTTGSLNNAAKEVIEKNKDNIEPTNFTGKNYINNSLGYLFSVEHPEKWSISYSPENAGKEGDGQYYVNVIDAGDGIVFRTSILNNTENQTIEYIAGAMYTAYAMLAQNDASFTPEINYDKPTQTAFFNGINVQNYKRLLMKIILKNGKGYFAFVEYPKELENDERVKELKEMVSTLTTI